MPAELKRLVIDWARREHDDGQSWVRLAKKIGVSGSALWRWVTEGVDSKRANSTSKSKSPGTTAKTALRLQLRPVQIAQQPPTSTGMSVDNSALRARGLGREVVHTVVVVHGLDIAAIAALTRALERRDSC